MQATLQSCVCENVVFAGRLYCQLSFLRRDERPRPAGYFIACHVLASRAVIIHDYTISTEGWHGWLAARLSRLKLLLHVQTLAVVGESGRQEGLIGRVLHATLSTALRPVRTQTYTDMKADPGVSAITSEKGAKFYKEHRLIERSY